MKFNLKNKTVVITGSSKGIGKELALKFALEQANVVVNYSESYDSALNLYKKMKEFNPNCLLIKADVTKQNDVKILRKETIKRFGKVDILINNAGKCSDNLIPFMTEDQWKRIIDINLNSVFLCSKAFSKEMIKNKSGKIINISSLKGQIGSEGQVNYSASKAGIIGFTKSLAKELGRFNISVNCICPGFIKTDLNSNNKAKKQFAEKSSFLSLDYSLTDLVNFITFFSSENIKGISGQIFNLDSRLK